MKNHFRQYKIKKIVDECFKLVESGDVGYLEFCTMTLEEMAEKIDAVKLTGGSRNESIQDIQVDKTIPYA